MEKSEQINELAAALCAAQFSFEEAQKTKENPHLRSKYADLGSVWDAAKPALRENGLCVSQLFVPSESGTLVLETVLIHKSGQYISGTLTMPLQKTDPQGFGAAATYARRYALSAILGICPDDDDDGHSASNRTQPRQTQNRAATSVPATRQEAAVEAFMPANSEVWSGPGQCPTCHAPPDKRHGRVCLDSLVPAS